MTGRGARSSLMRLVQGLARRARPGPADEHEALAALRTREALARKAQARESRREALRRGAALLGAGLVPLPVVAGAPSAPTIVVAGGGLAGLAAAWSLARAGHAVTLVEAAPRVGGRCWTERKAFDEGQIAERGGELIDTAHDEIIDLALALGLSLDDLAVASPRGTEGVAFIDGRRYSDADAVADFARLWPALQRDSKRLGDELPTFARATPAQAELDRLTARAWLATRTPGGLQSPLARLLANAYEEELGADLDEISAVTVVDLLRGSPQDRVSPYEVSDQRYHVRGGNDLLVERMAAALGPRIETGTRLQRRRAARGRTLSSSSSRATPRPASWSRTTSCSRCPSRCCARSTSTARACASASAWPSASSAWGATPSCSCNSPSGRGSPRAATGRRGWKGATR